MAAHGTMRRNRRGSNLDMIELKARYKTINVDVRARIVRCNGCGRETAGNPLRIEKIDGKLEATQYSPLEGWTIVWTASNGVRLEMRYCPDCTPAAQRAISSLPKMNGSDESE